MKIDRKKGSEERRILIGMIVDQTVLGRIGSKWKGRMFKSKWANIIAKWCLDYYKRYEEAPLNQIEGLYEEWSEKTQDKDTVHLVEKFLDSLSSEYEDLKAESNSDYIIDVAGKHFNRVQMERLVETVESNLSDGNISKAHSCLASYNQIEMEIGSGVDVFLDKEVIKKAFRSKQEPLIQYPGDLGIFFGEVFERGGFVAFIGPEKRGKSFWLADVAYRAMLQRKRVALFEAGDMGEDSVVRRLMVRAAHHPMKACTVKFPKSIVRNKDTGKVRVTSKRRTYNKKLGWRKAIKACKQIMRKRIKSRKSYFKLSAHPNTTLSVKMIEGLLQDWEKLDWIPDVIIVDYADILDMNYLGIEGRDRINQTWKLLRSLSQKYHSLVVTATQSDTPSYGKETMSMVNFSDDKRKTGHVTGMIGLNQTEREKEKGMIRLNWIVLREGAYSSRRCVYVAECRDLCNPAVKSTF